MSGGESQSRRELLQRISKARSQQQISDAGLAAKHHLQQYPSDTDVIAAAEKLHRRGAKLADPPDAATPREVAAYMGVALVLVFVPATVMLALGRSVHEALIVGVGLGALVFWDMALGVGAIWENFGKKAFRRLRNTPGS